jgi:pantoate--beta-alanine ligase
MVIVPTHRHPSTGLALSSRNAYLSPQEYAYAPCLYEALRLAETAFKGRQDQSAPFPAASLREVALQHLHKRSAAAAAEGVSLKADYFAFNEPGTLRSLEQIVPGQGAVMSGALWCGTTRLIDNLVLDYDLNAP